MTEKALPRPCVLRGEPDVRNVHLLRVAAVRIPRSEGRDSVLCPGTFADAAEIKHAQRTAGRSRTAAACIWKMLRDAWMTGLKKLRRGIGATGDRQLWAVQDVAGSLHARNDFATLGSVWARSRH